MHRECRERFPRHRLQRKPLVSDPGMHHGTCVTHVPWCISGSQTLGGGENVPGIPGACATRNFTYLARGPWRCSSHVKAVLPSVVTATYTLFNATNKIPKIILLGWIIFRWQICLLRVSAFPTTLKMTRWATQRWKLGWWWKYKGKFERYHRNEWNCLADRESQIPRVPLVNVYIFGCQRNMLYWSLSGQNCHTVSIVPETALGGVVL